MFCYISFVRKSSVERPRALKTVATGGHRGQPMQTNRLRNEATINVGAVATTTSPTTSTKDNCIVRSYHCRMVDSVPRWWLSLSWPIQSDHLSIADLMIPTFEREHSHDEPQYFPGKQVLVRSWRWKFYIYFLLGLAVVQVLVLSGHY